MSSPEKASAAARPAAHETIPPHLFSRIESEWQQMRSAALPARDPRPVSVSVGND